MPSNLTAEQQKHIEILKKHLKPQQIVTHVQCGGHIKEHIFWGYDEKGNLIGSPTKDTKSLHYKEFQQAPDAVCFIHPVNVIYVDREQVANLPAIADAAGELPQ